MSALQMNEEAAQGPIQAAPSPEAQPDYSGDPKRFSTLRARAALVGVELHACRNDAERWTFFAALGAETIEIPTLREVEIWLLGRFGHSAALEGHDAP